MGHFGEDAAYGPDVDRRRILLGSEEDLRRSVPEGDNLVCVGLDWESKGSGETEIR